MIYFSQSQLMPAKTNELHLHACHNSTAKRTVINTHFCPPFQHLLSERLTSLGIMGAPRVPHLNPSETIVLSEHYRLWAV